MKAKFGIEKLDDLLSGGLERETINLIVGRSGIGKTILASHWAAEGIKNGERVVYLSTTLTKKTCDRYLRSFTFMKDVYDKIEWCFVDIDAKDLFPLTEERVRDYVKTILGVKLDEVQRFVFDSVTSLDLALNDPVLYRRALRYIANLCHEHNLTTLLVEEAPVTGEWGEAKHLAECIIFLDSVRVPTGYDRAIRIIKRYGGKHPLDYIPYEISDDGILIKEGRYVRVNYEFHFEPD